jgi:hypothetical protein
MTEEQPLVDRRSYSQPLALALFHALLGREQLCVRYGFFTSSTLVVGQ